MIKNYLKIIGASLLLTACQRVFVPKIDNVPPALVAEGYLSTKSEVQTVFLTHTTPFDENGDYQDETGATVYVTDNQGNRFDYHENAAGIYRTDTLDQVKGIVGNTYVLHIETKEGDVYESTPQTIQECAPPSQLTCQPARQEVMSEDAYGDPVEFFQNGIEVYVSSHGILPVHNFYQYTWDTRIEYLLIEPGEMGSFSFYQYGKLVGKDHSVIRTGDADGLADHTIRNKKILFITFQDLNNFRLTVVNSDTLAYIIFSTDTLTYDLVTKLITNSGSIVNNFNIDSLRYIMFGTDTITYYMVSSIINSNIVYDFNMDSILGNPNIDSVSPTIIRFKGLFFKLQQRSLTPDAYQFWNGAENQLEANGSLFDPVASQIQSNIHCVSDSNKVVYGIFTAYDEKDKYAYFYANSKRAFSENVDSFPPTLPDTSFPIYPPNGWINPPF